MRWALDALFKFKTGIVLVHVTYGIIVSRPIG